MAGRPWWQGDDGTFNARAIGFIVALQGLNVARDRVEAVESEPYVALPVLECSWWIGALTEMCGRRKDDSMLEGFYWVRNKGSHKLIQALRQMMPGESGRMGVGGMGIAQMGGVSTPARWEHLPGPEDGSRKAYNNYLASRPIVETIHEAFDMLEEEFKGIQKATGITTPF